MGGGGCALTYIVYLLVTVVSVVCMSGIIPALGSRLTLGRRGRGFFIGFSGRRFSILGGLRCFSGGRAGSGSRRLGRVKPVPRKGFISSFGKGKRKVCKC